MEGTDALPSSSCSGDEARKAEAKGNRLGTKEMQKLIKVPNLKYSIRLLVTCWQIYPNKLPGQNQTAKKWQK